MIYLQLLSTLFLLIRNTRLLNLIQGIGWPVCILRAIHVILDDMYKWTVELLSCLPVNFANLTMYWTIRRASEDSDVESSRETSSARSTDCETDRRLKGGVDGAWGKHNSQGTNKPPTSSSSDEMKVGKSPGRLVFEYFEHEQPHHRKPLYDKASSCFRWWCRMLS